uniref:Uncharacterized protein n=1 Tax=Panagrolaimus superbus TaxID=310955 RepID=A0A914YZJ9_9BILA
MNCCCFKIFFAAFLLLNSANFQENFSNNAKQLLDGKIHKELADEMLSDDIGIQQGNDVKLMKPGSINLTLTLNKLEFEVCKRDCIGESKVCYESLNGLSDTNAVGSCSGLSSCEFKVKNDEEDNTLLFGEITHVRKSLFFGCLTSTMKYPLVEVLKNLEFESCDPKVNPADKMIKLQVIHLSSCPIIVKNAKIHVPEVASTKPPPTPNPIDSSLTASFPWWGILIIVFAFVLAGIGIAYCLFKKRQASKHANIKPTVSNTNVATLESPSKRKKES